ncbi:MAG: AAA family ATPase [Chloroflexi bacterium]|nr:AAA family ATPase [Chloroflexota bacterium]
MGSRLTGEGPAKVYAAAEKWVDAALRTDDSLFTPGKPVWTLDVLGEVRENFLDRPNEGSGSFMNRLQAQLDGCSPKAYQLVGEVMYVHFLITDKGMNRNTKVNYINQVLGWASPPFTMPQEAADGFGIGLMGTGQSFHNHRPYHIGFILEFVEHWKQQPANEQQSLLDNPWAFKDFLWQTPLTSELLKNDKNKPTLQRLALLHLIFPDTFEAIVSTAHRQKIFSAFAGLADEPDQDIDRRLQQLRRHFEAKYGSPNHLFYREAIKSQWDGTEPHNPDPSPWDVIVKRAKAYVTTGNLEKDEINYKLDIARKLAEAREAVLTDGGDWAGLVKRGIVGNLVFNIQLSRFRTWVDSLPQQALNALKTLWRQDDSPIEERIRKFSALLPKANVPDAEHPIGITGSGTRANVISVLLMALGAEDHPPFRMGVFDKAYELTGFAKPGTSSDEVELYTHAMKFLNKFIEEAGERGLPIHNLLEAQSILWMIGDWEEDEDNGKGGGLENSPTLASLATDLYLHPDFLRDIVLLLEEKKQIIFQGPPGTGKTFLARELAKHLADGDDGRVTLVQFHPSYAYEDFVQGFRPDPDGRGGFALRDGPLLRAARAAQQDLDAARAAGQDPDSASRHYLIIDEINRGNLGKVFGELYFLLEYRDEAMRLQYADTDFSLPPNLYIIGTMNTADRSIALVDLALRRRFYFMDFHPDEEPIKGVLRRWLAANAPEMEWAADVVNAANEKLKDDRHAAIGPSYFMRPGLDDAAVERIWKHSVLPYLTERLYENAERLAEFDLNKLRAEVEISNGNAGGSGPAEAEEGPGDADDDGGESSA